MTMKIDGTEKEFSVDTGLPVTIIPPDKEKIENKKLLLLRKIYQEVIKSDGKFLWKSTAEAENRGIRKNLNIFITEREDIQQLLRNHWLRKFNWTTQNSESTTNATDQSEKDRLITNFEKLF